MRIPSWLLRQLPMWSFLCPKCRQEVKQKSHKCPHCGERFPLAIRVPPSFLKDPKKLEEYVHKHIFPRVSEFERNYLTKFFTILFSDGFESGDFSAWTGTEARGAGSISVSSTQKHHGNYAAYQNSPTVDGGDRGLCYKNLAAGVNVVYLRAYFYFPLSFEWAGSILIKLGDVADLRLMAMPSSASILRSHNYATDIEYDSSAFVTLLNTWYCLELAVLVDSTNGWIRGWFDANLVLNQTSINTGTTYVSGVTVGNCYNWVPTEFYWDCVVVADAYIGPEGPPKPKGTITIHAKLGVT